MARGQVCGKLLVGQRNAHIIAMWGQLCHSSPRASDYGHRRHAQRRLALDLLVEVGDILSPSLEQRGGFGPDQHHAFGEAPEIMSLARFRVIQATGLQSEDERLHALGRLGRHLHARCTPEVGIIQEAELLDRIDRVLGYAAPFAGLAKRFVNYVGQFNIYGPVLRHGALT